MGKISPTPADEPNTNKTTQSSNREAQKPKSKQLSVGPRRSARAATKSQKERQRKGEQEDAANEIVVKAAQKKRQGNFRVPTRSG